MKKYISIMSVLFLSACGQEPVVQQASQPAVVTTPTPSPETAPAVKPEPPKPIVKARVSSGGGGSHPTAPAVITEEPSTEEPTPCVENEECGEGKVCVESECIDKPYVTPECVEDTDCPETYVCNEDGNCIAPPEPDPLPEPDPEPVVPECTTDSECAPDQFCNEAGSCEILLPAECAPVGETVDPESVTVSPDGTGTTAEEIQADIDFTISQLQIIFPSLDLLSISLVGCSAGPSRDAIMERFTALDAVRIELDNHLASQNVRLGAL